jgi:hypothetical protein
MARKKAPRPSRVDRAAEEADYAAWKLAAVAELTNRHDVKAGTIPERLWKRLYIQGLSPREAADQTAVSSYNTRPAFERMRKR